MLRLFCAWSLLVLALSPFTAPFATCDLGTLVGQRPAPPALSHAPGAAVISPDAPLSAGDLASAAVRPQTVDTRGRIAAVLAAHRRGLVVAAADALPEAGRQAAPQRRPAQSGTLRI